MDAAARTPPPPAPASRFDAAALGVYDDGGDGGGDDDDDDLDPERGIMSGFRRVAATGFADAPPSAQELQAQKARPAPCVAALLPGRRSRGARAQAAAQLEELRRLRIAAVELLRGRDDEAAAAEARGGVR